MGTHYHWILSLLLVLFVLKSNAQTLGFRENRSDFSKDSAVPTVAAQRSQNSADCACEGRVIAGIVITALLLCGVFAVWWYKYGRFYIRKDRRKVDAESVERAAYDNPQFENDDYDPCALSSDLQKAQNRLEVPPVASTASTLEREKTTLTKVMEALVRRNKHNDLKRTKDDLSLSAKDVIVPLEGHDFTGLGFTVEGNLKEGLYIRDVMSRGPASQSGEINTGDRVQALTILTNHIVYKDAIAILNFASPYPLLLHLRKNTGTVNRRSFIACPAGGSRGKSPETSYSKLKLMHPSFRRSQSQGDLTNLEDSEIENFKLNSEIQIHKSKSASNAIKTSNELNPSRKVENRHSERAIDVPGVKNFQSGSGDNNSAELAKNKKPDHVAISLDEPDTPTKEPLKENSWSHNKLNNIKNKFGVKVIPEMPFIKFNQERGKNKEDINNRNAPASNLESNYCSKINTENVNMCNEVKIEKESKCTKFNTASDSHSKEKKESGLGKVLVVSDKEIDKTDTDNKINQEKEQLSKCVSISSHESRADKKVPEKLKKECEINNKTNINDTIPKKNNKNEHELKEYESDLKKLQNSIPPDNSAGENFNDKIEVPKGEEQVNKTEETEKRNSMKSVIASINIKTHLPNLNFLTHSTVSKTTSLDSKIDKKESKNDIVKAQNKEVKNKVAEAADAINSEENINSKKATRKLSLMNGFKFEMPDLHMPELHMPNFNLKRSVKLDIDNNNRGNESFTIVKDEEMPRTSTPIATPVKPKPIPRDSKTKVDITEKTVDEIKVSHKNSKKETKEDNKSELKITRSPEDDLIKPAVNTEIDYKSIPENSENTSYSLINNHFKVSVLPDQHEKAKENDKEVQLKFQEELNISKLKHKDSSPKNEKKSENIDLKCQNTNTLLENKTEESPTSYDAELYKSEISLTLSSAQETSPEPIYCEKDITKVEEQVQVPEKNNELSDKNATYLEDASDKLENEKNYTLNTSISENKDEENSFQIQRIEELVLNVEVSKSNEQSTKSTNISKRPTNSTEIYYKESDNKTEETKAKIAEAEDSDKLLVKKEFEKELDDIEAKNYNKSKVTDLNSALRNIVNNANVEGGNEKLFQIPRVKLSNIKTQYLKSTESFVNKLEDQVDEQSNEESESKSSAVSVSILREKFNMQFIDAQNENETDTQNNSVSKDSCLHKTEPFLQETDFVTSELKNGPADPHIELNSQDDFNFRWRQATSKNGICLSEGLRSGSPNTSTSVSSDVNISLDSSCLETESDLPEVDSYLKNNELNNYNLETHIPRLSFTKMNLEKNFNKSQKTKPFVPDFKNIPESDYRRFGFKGFHHKSSVESNDYINKNKLPEVDYDLDYNENEKSITESDENFVAKENFKNDDLTNEDRYRYVNGITHISNYFDENEVNKIENDIQLDDSSSKTELSHQKSTQTIKLVNGSEKTPNLKPKAKKCGSIENENSYVNHYYENVEPLGPGGSHVTIISSDPTIPARSLDKGKDVDPWIDLRNKNETGVTNKHVIKNHWNNTMNGEVSLLNTSSKFENNLDVDNIKNKKAVSMGDLSRLDANGSSVLERTASLDLKNPKITVNKLKLPENSDILFDELDDIKPKSPKILGTNLKSASQWGTLQEAMSLDSSHYKITSTVSAPQIRPRITTNRYENDNHCTENGFTGSRKLHTKDHDTKNFKMNYADKTMINVNGTAFSNLRKLSDSEPNMLVIEKESHYQQENLNDHCFRYSPEQNTEESDAGGVTLTMVTAETRSRPLANGVTLNSTESVNHLRKIRPVSMPPDLVAYETSEPSLITVNHGRINGKRQIETEIELSDEFVTPETTPRKFDNFGKHTSVKRENSSSANENCIPVTTEQGKTQITLDGNGYTVTEGITMRTVIISKPEML